ncbi:MAG: zinc-ribbon domain-containing protein [Bdellovibrio sp.]|nr:zinc-ribbon domain-containing protein [Methylotenera sp.]
MNYITSCPACETQFLLTTEHIKAHRGKVQCGQCEHIFNAKNRLTEISDDIHSTAEYKASLESNQQTDLSNNTTPNIAQNVEDKPINAVLEGVLGAVPNLEDLNANNSIYTNADDPFIGDQTHINIDDNYSYEDETPITIDDLATTAKLEKKKTKLNIWLLLLGLLLVILACLQTIYFLRSKIASEYPQFKPYLKQACGALQCNIDLPKNLDLFTIDDSDMQESENYEKVIDFSSLLINNANNSQAYPNIELTLTDTDDKPVVRRLITPTEYLKTNAKLANGMPSKDEVRVKLAISVADLSVVGYRVLLTY